jgi:hypothetical protein
MAEVQIKQVRLDHNRRLRLRADPSKWVGYDLIHRDASGVRWDELTGELYVLEVSNFTFLDEFKQIVTAVEREYSDKLMLSASTAYVDIPMDWVATLREYTERC